jgi:hypothetical protein
MIISALLVCIGFALTNPASNYTPLTCAVTAMPASKCRAEVKLIESDPPKVPGTVPVLAIGIAKDYY